MAKPGGSWSGLLSDETDVDALSLSMPPEDIRTSAIGGKGSSKRSSNYTQEEDIQLCVSWENISTDPIVGNEQPGKAYWKRIAEHFHANRTFHSNRSVNSLEHHWDTIKKECSKFQAFYEQVERRHPSGIPYKEHLLEAQTMYASKPPNKAFQFIHCWLKVRNCPKFQSVDKSHKRPRPSKSSTPSEGGAEEQEGDGSGKSQTNDPTQTSQNKRPAGRKGAKKRLKTGGDAGPYKEAVEELMVEKKEEKKLREEEKKLKEERWRETKMIHQQKLSLEKEKFMWEQEQRIMFCDVNSLDPDQKTYVLAMRAQIVAQKMAAFSGGLNDGFDSGFGSSTGGSECGVNETAQQGAA